MFLPKPEITLRLSSNQILTPLDMDQKETDQSVDSTASIDPDNNGTLKAARKKNHPSTTTSPNCLSLPAENPDESGIPYIILESKDNSFPFTERRISLKKPAKVGRSIGRIRPSQNNAIFDCKVLSRNHAMLWFESDCFFIQDSGSSNGTFINNCRMGVGNESLSVLMPGDTVKFGVEVVEKNNVHSCIIATVRLVGPDGNELQPSVNSCSSHQNSSDHVNIANLNVSPSQLIQLSHLINDASCKQQLLEKQLEAMKSVMATTLEAAKSGWCSSIENDKLFSRIETLNSKVAALTLAGERSPPDPTVEALKNEMMLLINDRVAFEQQTKESLEKALNEKNTTDCELKSAQLKLHFKEQECDQLRASMDETSVEMNTLAEHCERIKQERDDLAFKLKDFTEEFERRVSNFELEHSKIQEQVETLATRESDFKVKLEEFSLAKCESATQTTTEEPNLCVANQETERQQSLEKYRIQLESFTRELASLKGRMEIVASEMATLFTTWTSLLDQLEAQTESLFTAVCTLKTQLESSKQAYNEKLASIVLQIKSQQAQNDELNESVQNYESIISKQNEEIGKFKCDIDVLDSKLKLVLPPPPPPPEVCQDVCIQTESSVLSQPIIDQLKRLDLLDTEVLDEESLIARLDTLKHNFDNIALDNQELNKELAKVKEEYKCLSHKNILSFRMAFFPLFVILLGILIAFHPLVAYFLRA